MAPKLSPIVCKNCALLLIRRCYGRHWWFRVIREPLVWGMRILAWRNGIYARSHGVRNPECRGCVRFMKAELEEKSDIFIVLNKHIGPRFKLLRDSTLSREDFDEAKHRARERMEQKEEE